MAFQSIARESIDRGRGAKKELFDLIADNLDDLNGRVGGSGGQSATIFNDSLVGFFPIDTVFGIYVTPEPLELQECVISVIDTIENKSALIELDILSGLNASVTQATSIFQTRPTVENIKGRTSGNAVFKPDAISVAAGTYFFLTFKKYPDSAKLSHLILR